jgi:hypothetical protein
VSCARVRRLRRGTAERACVYGYAYTEWQMGEV